MEGQAPPNILPIGSNQSFISLLRKLGCMRCISLSPMCEKSPNPPFSGTETEEEGDNGCSHLPTKSPNSSHGVKCLVSVSYATLVCNLGMRASTMGPGGHNFGLIN